MIRLHLIANAVLLLLGYYWLGVGESSIPRLLWSALLALLILSAALWVHFKPAMRNLPLLLLLSVVVIAVYALLAAWPDYSFPVASWMTLKTRKPIKPETIHSMINVVLLVVRWMLIPWLVVPLAVAMARDGISGIKLSAWRRPRLYWLELPLLLLIAITLPLKLMSWIPSVKPFWLQVTSLTIRSLIAYLLFTVSLWLLFQLTRPATPSSAPTPPQPAPEQN